LAWLEIASTTLLGLDLDWERDTLLGDDLLRGVHLDGRTTVGIGLSSLHRQDTFVRGLAVGRG
jgi:hypothetical protein